MLDLAWIGIALGWLRGGKLRNLANIKLNCFGCILLSFVFSFLISNYDKLGFSLTAPQISLVYFCSYLLLLIGLLANWYIPGFAVALVGVAANFVVILLNGMTMPVTPGALPWIHPVDFYHSSQALTHSLLNSATKLPFFADIILVPAQYPFSGAYSVGDLLLLLGLTWAIQSLMIGQR